MPAVRLVCTAIRRVATAARTDGSRFPGGPALGFVVAAIAGTVTLAHATGAARYSVETWVAVLAAAAVLAATGLLRWSGSGGTSCAISDETTAEAHGGSEQLDFAPTLLESLPMPVFFKAPDGRYVGCNWAFEAFFGRSRDEMIGADDSHLLPPELVDDFRSSDRIVLDAGEVQVHELALRRADGELRHVVVHKSAVPAADGSIGGIIGIVTDVTERKEAEEAMRLAAEVFEHSGEGIFVVGEQRTILTVNRGFTEITGYAAEEACGRHPEFLSEYPEDDRTPRAIEEALAATGVWRGELVNRRKDGQPYVVWATIAGVRDESGEFRRYVSILTDITALKAAEERIRHMAHHDALTGLPNRSLFEERFQSAIARARRNGTLVALMLLDLDRFKAVNDTLGHEAGDQLLRQAAGRITACVRETDTVARLGGDEFIVVLTDLRWAGDVERVASALTGAFGEPFQLDAGPAVVGSSIGIALWPLDGTERETLTRVADAAMYEVKRAGRNDYRFSKTVGNDMATLRCTG